MCNLNKGTPQQKSMVALQALPPWDGSCLAGGPVLLWGRKAAVRACYCSSRCIQGAEGKHLHDRTALCSRRLQEATVGLTSEAETTLRRHLSKGSPRFHAVIAQLQGVLAWDMSCWH